MKKLMLFESFSNFLNEIKFTNHWKERSALPKEKDSGESRILQYSDQHKNGWTLEGLIDKRRNPIDMEKFLDGTGISEEELKKDIVQALRIITRNPALEKWSDNTPLRYQLLSLGRIGIFNGTKTAYPLLKTRKEEKGTSYEPADGVWGISDRNEGVTFMYFTSDKKGAEAFYEQAKKVSKMRDLDFLNNTNFFSPYGTDFELIIDASDAGALSRKMKMEKQVLGEEIQFGPKKETKYESIPNPEPQRKTLSPGDNISAVVKYVSQTDPIPGRIIDILNIKDIQTAQKAKNLDKIKEIKIQFVPDSEEHRKFGPDGKVLAIPITLTDKSVLGIDGVKYKVLGPSGSKPLVTSEPSILDKGSVQTWLEETK